MRWWRKREREQELDREVRDHLDLEAAEQIERGLSKREAGFAAQRAFGSTIIVKEDVREAWGWTRWGQFKQDVRYAGRQLRKSPGFSVVAILTVALGIGANAAMFSVVDAVLIRPLPYKDANGLVMVWEDATSIGFPQNTPSPWNWQEWRRLSPAFSDIAATRKSTSYLTGDGEPERLEGRAVSANFWPVLGVAPMLGHVFTEEEDRHNARVVVISYGLWQRRFGGARDVVGRDVVIDETGYTVIGVMPKGFYFYPSRDVDIWKPAGYSPQELNNRGSHYLNCVARLKPGVTIEQARSVMTAIGKAMLAKDPVHQSMPVIVPLREQLAGKSEASLVVLLCASLAILLIACANLANLLLARGAVRWREVALRTALGAGRGRLIRQFLTEALLLAFLGAIAGLALARPAMVFLETLVPSTMIVGPLTLNGRVLLYSMAVTAAAGILFGLAPALRVSAKGALQESLKEGARGTAGSRSHWFQHSLVIAETALAVVLLTGGGLLLETFHHLLQVDLGIRTDKLLTMLTPIGRFRDLNRRVAYTNEMLEKIRAVPGVVGAGSISDLPFTTIGNTSSYRLAGQNSDQGQDALKRVVTHGYFATVGARLREGRFFEESDRVTKEPVALVNETFADRHFAGRSALGARFQIGDMGPEAYSYTIVGVVKEIRERGVTADLKPAVYLLHEQSDQAFMQPTDLVIRTSVPPNSIVPAVREAVWSLDKNQPMAKIRTLDAIIADELLEPSQDSTLMAAFAGLALVLACIGLYGVLSYAVTQRTNEIGVRMALGANRGDIIAMVLRGAFTLILLGLFIGVPLALAAGRFLASQLYGTNPYNPGVTMAAVAALGLSALMASLVPALRASLISPLNALRSE